MPVILIQPPRNPLLRLLAAVVGILAVVGAFMLGLVAIAVIAGFALVLGTVVGLRRWWALRRGENTPSGAGVRTRRREAIEAEYEVISRRSRPGD